MEPTIAMDATSEDPFCTSYLSLIDAPLPVKTARHHVEQVFEWWGLSAEACYDAETVVSELTTNAVRHGGGATDLRLTLAGQHLMITVGDCSPDDTPLPSDGCAADDEERGRGWYIVEFLTCGCGFRRVGDRKEAWADLEVAAQQPASLHYTAA